jgi:CheY-like chemotaxis protein
MADSPKILVIDDEWRILRSLRYQLHAAGFEVLLAAAADEGLALARSEQPNVVLLDLYIPEMSGLAVLERLQADPVTHYIPVVMVTGDDVEERLVCEDGACGLLRKPFNRASLLAAVDKALGLYCGG